MFLLIFAGFAQVFANNYILSSTADLDLNFSPEQQTVTVTGKVTDRHTGESIPGVNIKIKDTTIGTITDIEGKYSLSVSDKNAIMVFSFIGYIAQEIQLGGKTTVDVVLANEVHGLDEVIVVGYGTQSKLMVTGSVTKVDMAKSAYSPTTNIIQAIRGTVAGIQVTDNGRPGVTGAILIRGPRSLSASNSPLIVLDGIIFSGDLSDINSNDIKSLEVLKDASAAAIYGSRAANGVILVTSKAGISEAPSIKLNAFNGVSDWGYKVKEFSTERYVQSKLDWREQSGLEHDPSKILTYLYPTEATNYKAGISHNAWDESSQPSKIGSYDLNISGKTKFTNYYISGAFSDERGLLFNDNAKKSSVRVNIDNKVTNWLTVGINSMFNHRDLSGVTADLGNAYGSSPLGNYYYSDGEPTQWVVPEDTGSNGQSLYSALLTTNQEIYDNLFSNIYAKISFPFIKGLNYRVNYSPNYRWGHNYNFFRQDKHLLNNTQTASKFNQQNFDWVLENILTYANQFGKNHSLDFTLLYGRGHTGFESTTSTANQLSSGENGYNNLALGNVLLTSSTANSTESVSSMFRVNYRFKETYLVTLTARRDGSSVFAANNKYATFPSGSLAWIVTNEPFMKSATFLNMLKLRLSYGALGNQAISPYQSLSSSSINQYVYGDGGPTSLGIYPSTMGNADLKWETTKTTNAAIDFELFKGRLGGTIEVYNSNTSNLLVRRSIPTMTGYTNIFTNIGLINNRGLELTLNSVNIQSGKFNWNTNFVISANRNKIVHLYFTDVNGDGIEDNDISNSWFIGYPITSYYDYVFDGIYQTGDEIPSGSKPGFVRLKDLNGDKIINAEDRKIVGSGGQPDYRFSITNNFTFGNFTLSIFANAMLGWESRFNLLNTAVSPNAPGRGLNQLDAGYWTAENKSATRPSLVYNNPMSHGWYVSRNFVRIQDASLSYKFPETLLKMVKLSSLTVYASAKNLYTFTKWPGSDPESGGSSSGSFYPMPRTIAFGVNIGIN
ncbi:MAG: TonB-dependent receptor [Prolixibacteraceae bacterium]